MNESKDKGWIKMSRSILDEWFWDENKGFDRVHAWVDILLNVSYKEQKYAIGDEVITIKEGSVITSALKLSKRWKWDRRKVTVFLNNLKKSGKINYKKLGNGIIIEVLEKESENESEKPNGDFDGNSNTNANFDLKQNQLGNKDEREGAKSPESLIVTETDAFFCTLSEQLDEQPSEQPIEQPTEQPYVQRLHTIKESNKGNNVNNGLEGDKVRKEEACACPEKINYAYNILLTEDEYKSLTEEYGKEDTDAVIGIVSEYKKQKSKHYDSDYRAICKWGFSALSERREKQKSALKSGDLEVEKSFVSDEAAEFERLMLKRNFAG